MVSARVTDRNGWARSGASGAVKGLASAPQTREQASSVGHALGRAAGGFIAGALNKKHDEEDQQARDASRAKRVLDAAGAADEARRKARLNDAQVGKLEEETRYLRDVKPREVAARELRDERGAVLSELRLKKGSKLSPDDPVVARAGRAGMHIDVDAFNNSSSNGVGVTLVDPDNPTQTRRVMLNKATGEIVDVGQAGYVQPVGEDGMTPAQRESLDLSRQRVKLAAQNVELNARRFMWETSQGIPAAAKRAFDVEAGPLQKELTSRLSEIKSWQQKVESNAVMPDVAAKHISELEGRVAELQSQIGAARERALSSGGAGCGSSGGARMFTEAEVRARAAERGQDPDEAVRKVRAAGRLRQ